MPLMWWCCGPEPVAMSEHATGVTDGKAETQSPISAPRSSRAAKLGARSSATARSSMSVRSESTTIRQSLRETCIDLSLTAAEARASPEHPQALVLALRAAPAGGSQPNDSQQRDQGDRTPQQREGGEDHRTQRDDQPDRRGAVVPG